MSLLPTLRHAPPLLPHNGLVVILSNPSRIDIENKRLIAGQAATNFELALKPTSRFATHIYGSARDVEELGGLPSTTRVILTCSEHAKNYATHVEDVSYMDLRGSPVVRADGIIVIPTFAPQDVMDMQNYEQKFNPLLQDNDDEDDETEGSSAEAKDETSLKTTKAPTLRSNWNFWFTKDVAKACRILKTGLLQRTPTYFTAPPPEVILEVLTNTKNSLLFFDIETDPLLNITVFSFAFTTHGTIYTVPVSTYTGAFYYERLPQIFRALSVALRDNTVVIHNAKFDLLVLLYRYRLPIGRRVFDTMLGFHRMFPEVEKSLGHVLSVMTDLEYHKNEGIFEPRTGEQERQLWAYNAKDVFALQEIYPRMLEEAQKMGCVESIEQVNASIVPYLCMELTGMRLDEELIAKKISARARRCNQLLRILEILCGRSVNPRSSQQVAKYLYAPIEKGGLGMEKPKKDLTKEETLLKLLIKHDLLSIRVILEYRGLMKEASTLQDPERVGAKTKGGLRRWFGLRKGKQCDKLVYPRLVCQYKLSGTDTFRLSSSKLLG